MWVHTWRRRLNQHESCERSSCRMKLLLPHRRSFVAKHFLLCSHSGNPREFQPFRLKFLIPNSQFHFKLKKHSSLHYNLSVSCDTKSQSRLQNHKLHISHLTQWWDLNAKWTLRWSGVSASAWLILCSIWCWLVFLHYKFKPEKSTSFLTVTLCFIESENETKHNVETSNICLCHRQILSSSGGCLIVCSTVWLL